MSRDDAVQYIADHTAMPRSQIEKEVDRYITWPGQACAYKMGERQILRLRQIAEQELGNFIQIMFWAHFNGLKHYRKSVRTDKIINLFKTDCFVDIHLIIVATDSFF